MNISNSTPTPVNNYRKECQPDDHDDIPNRKFSVIPSTKVSLLSLPEVPWANIIDNLNPTDIDNLNNTCLTTRGIISLYYSKYYNKLVSSLPLAHQVAITNTKLKLTGKCIFIWMHQFSKNELLVKEVVEIGLMYPHWPYYCFQATSILMDKCKTFNIEKKYTITGAKDIAGIFSNDSHHLLTISKDHTATISSKNLDNNWEKVGEINSPKPFISGCISSDSRNIALSSSNPYFNNHTVEIYSINSDGIWMNTCTMLKETYPCVVSFIPNSNHLMTL